MPRRHPLPARRAVLRRGGAPAGRRRRRRRGQHPPLRPPPRQRRGACCPSTTSSSSTRPTSSRTSSRPPPGCRIGAGRFVGAGPRSSAAVADRPTWPPPLDRRRRRASAAALRPVHRPAPARSPARRRRPTPLVLGRGRVDEAARPRLRAIDTDVGEANQRKVRAQKAATTLVEDLDARPRRAAEGYVAWVDGTAAAPRLEVAPIDVGPVLATRVWDKRTAVLTSATIPLRLPERLGLPADAHRRARRRQPVRLRGARPPLLRRPPARPPQPALRRAEPRRARGAHRRRRRAHAGAVHQLAGHAGRGRRPAARAARTASSPRTTCPSPRCSAAFADDEPSCLFATVGLSRASTCPAPSLASSPSTACRSPGPTTRCSGPAGAAPGRRAFRLIDLPRAATLLAQAAGRLIRTRHRPGRGRRARPAPGQGRLPLGHRAGAAADAPHPPPRRGRGLPAIAHRADRSRSRRDQRAE